jgi:hypothetical protein
MRRAIFWASATALLSACPFVPSEAAVLDPSGAWQVERTDESCRLGQDFGTGGGRISFHVFAFGPDDSYRVTLTGADIPRNDGEANVLRIGFGAAPELREYVVIESRLGDQGRLNFHLTGPSPAYRYFRGWELPGSFEGPQPEVLWPARLTQLTVENSDMGQLVLNLGDMTGPLAQLRICQQELAASWGWDQDRLRLIAVEPELIELRQVVERMRMPPAMVLNHVSVTAQLRIVVDEQGHGSDCVVQAPVLPDRARRDLCGPFESGVQFAPARDAAGNAVPGLVRLLYTYFIFN